MADELTFAELLVASGPADAMAYLIGKLGTKSLPILNWLPTGLYRSLAAAVADFAGDLASRVPTIAKSGFVKWATGGWLDLIGESAYNLPRQPSQFAVVYVRLTNAEATPQTITLESLWITKNPSDGRRWSNITAGTLPASGVLDLEFRAEFAGAEGSSGFALPSSPSLTLQTTLAGVTVAVQETLDADGVATGTCVVTAGADEETDEQYRQRLPAQWGTLAFAGPKLAYEAYGRAASESVRRVYVDDSNPSGPGTVDVYLAGDAGAVGSADVAATDAVIQVRKSPTAVVTTQSASARVVALAAQVECPEGLRGAARAYTANKLASHLRDLAIGDGAGAGKLKIKQIEEFLMGGIPDPDGDILDLTLDGLSASVTPLKGEVITVDPADLDPDTMAWIVFS